MTRRLTEGLSGRSARSSQQRAHVHGSGVVGKRSCPVNPDAVHVVPGRPVTPATAVIERRTCPCCCGERSDPS